MQRNERYISEFVAIRLACRAYGYALKRPAKWRDLCIGATVILTTIVVLAFLQFSGRRHLIEPLVLIALVLSLADFLRVVYKVQRRISAYLREHPETRGGRGPAA